MNQPHTTTLCHRRTAFAESCHYSHCMGMKPNRRRRMISVLNKFDWGTYQVWKWMKKLWRLA